MIKELQEYRKARLEVDVPREYNLTVTVREFYKDVISTDFNLNFGGISMKDLAKRLNINTRVAFNFLKENGYILPKFDEWDYIDGYKLNPSKIKEWRVNIVESEFGVDAVLNLKDMLLEYRNNSLYVNGSSRFFPEFQRDLEDYAKNKSRGYNTDLKEKSFASSWKKNNAWIDELKEAWEVDNIIFKED